MSEYIAPLQALVDQFRRLPGIGKKTAVRLAFGVLGFSETQAQDFADAVIAAKRDINECRICHNYSTGDECEICRNSQRDPSIVCVVEDARAIMSLERVRQYNGLYHVLGGALSPMNGIGPDKLNINTLMNRIAAGEIKEVILATNPTVEGEATALYVSKLIKPSGVTVSRLALGIPVGGDLEYADEVTLDRALAGRREI
jgi:recombination protein RecR